MKSAVIPKSCQQQSGSHNTSTGSQGQSSGQSRITSSGASRHGSDKHLGDPERKELKDKVYNWITSHMNHLDPKGYVQEINSLRHFEENTKTFALEIKAIIDWGHKYVDAGFHYLIPIFPHYLFNQFGRSQQGGGKIPK